MAIERRLTEIAGPVGGKLHTARSRNDQVATDMALFVREQAEGARRRLCELMGTLTDLAERHADWPMPGYTHLQRAQPVYLGHHLLAYFWMFRRDVERFAEAVCATAELPLGAGALAGVNWDTRRDSVARELGFDGVVENSLDAVSNRDFVLDYLSAAAICAMHLSRLGAELVLWSSEEFGFLELGDSFTSGSSIMPQKKNPDAAELLRAKAPRVAADLSTLLGVMHALPLAYNKDMQEDKEPLFDAVDTLNLCLEAATGMLRTAAFNRERLAGRGGRRVPGRDRHRRPARAPRRAVPRVARGGRRAGAPRARGRQAPVRAHPRRAGGVLRPPRRRVLHGAVQRLLAGVEGVRGRNRVRTAVRAASARPCGAGGRGAVTPVAKRDARMVSLGYGKFVKADRVYALVPIESGERGDGRRTYVHVDGLSEPLVASRSERAILADVEAALTEAAGVPAPGATAGRARGPGEPLLGRPASERRCLAPTAPRLRGPPRDPRSTPGQDPALAHREG